MLGREHDSTMSSLEANIDALVSAAKRTTIHVPVTGLRSLRWLCVRSVISKLAVWHRLHHYLRLIPGNENLPLITTNLPQELQQLISEGASSLSRRTRLPDILHTRWIRRIKPQPQNIDVSWIIACLTSPLYSVSLDDSSDFPGLAELEDVRAAIPLRLLHKDILTELPCEGMEIVGDALHVSQLFVADTNDDGIYVITVRVGEQLYTVESPDMINTGADVWGCYCVDLIRAKYPDYADILSESAKAFPNKFVTAWDAYTGGLKEYYESTYGSQVEQYVAEAEYWNLPPALE
jgi:hypothetical protein